MIGYAGLFNCVIGTFDPCAAAANGAIKNAGQRQVNYPEHAFAVFGQPNLHGKIAIAVDEAIGASEWIGLGNGLAIVRTRFLADIERALVMIEYDRARFTRQLEGETQLKIIGWLVRWCHIRSSPVPKL